MERLEQNNLGEQFEKKRQGIPLCKLIEQNNLKSEQSIYDMLKLILEENSYLANIEVVFIDPEEEPDTGGFFHRVQVDAKSFVPTIFIVSENEKHITRLKNVRASSARRVADLLGIDFTQLSSNLLRQFIIAHEIGHASDYVKNYETNPNYNGVEVAKEWDFHYEANLYSLPVPGFDPVDLRLELEKFQNLDEFLAANPALIKSINLSEIKTLDDLVQAQEIAYRNSPYESYADNFATNFLKKNKEKLHLSELNDDFQFKLAS